MKNNYKWLKLYFGALLLSLGGMIGFGIAGASALTYNITPSSACTLPNAITAADTDTITGACAAGGTSNTISMAAGTYTLGADLPAITTHDLTVNGAGSEQTIIDGANTHQMFNITSNSLDTVFSNFSTTGAAGVNDSWYSIADHNGGGTLNISNVVFRDSTVGGAVLISEPGSITNSAFTNVKGPNGGAVMFGVFGSGVFNITNTTIDGNTGSGVYVDTRSGGTINLINDTIANNSAGQPAGIAISNTNSGPGTIINLENTILANNIESGSTAANCGVGGGGFGFELPVSLGHNISDDTSCSTAFNQAGDINNKNVLLGSLVLDNNSYVLPITSASPAYNAADPTASPSTDQVGTARPQCSTYDIGAYELPIASCPSSSSSTTSNGNSAAPGAPNTGLKQQSVVIYIVAGIMGLSLLSYEYNKFRLAKNSTKTTAQ